MNRLNLKDKEFKQTIPSDSFFYGSDCQWEKNGQIYLIEYENSSRGMTSNLLRILRIKESNPKDVINVLFIRTENHVKKHNNDKRNFDFILSIYNKQKVQVLCLDTLDPMFLTRNFVENLFKED